MWKKETANILWAAFGMGFLLIAFADQRISASVPLYPLDIVAIVIILIAAYFFLKNKEWNFIKKSARAPMWLALGIFFCGSVISWLFNNPGATGLGQLKSWIVFPGLAAFFSASLLQGQKQRDKNFLHAMFFGLVALLVVLLPYFLFNIRTFDDRFQGPFTSPNFLAFFVVLGSLLSAYFYKQASLFFEKSIFALLSILFLLVLFMTHSFGGLLALCGGIAWYFFRTLSLKKRDALKTVMAIVLFLLILIGMEATYGNKLAHVFEERSSLASRVIIWTVATDAIRENPILGIGIGKFQEVYLSYQLFYPPYLEWAVPQPHNFLLALWLQTGLLGLFAFLWFLIKVFSSPQRENSHEEQIVLQGLLVAMLVYGIFDTPLFGNALAFCFWIVLGFLLFPEAGHKKNSSQAG